MRYRTAALTALAVAGLAAATPAAEAKPTKLAISSARVEAGDAVRVSGAGWPGRRGVSLFVTRRGDERERLVVVRADRRGRFSRRVRIDADALAGRYDVTACSSGCRRTRTVRLTVTQQQQPVQSEPQPVETVPVAAPNGIAELERRMKGTQMFDSEQLGNCSSVCSLSEITQRFCSDGSWTQDTKGSGLSNSVGHEEGSWRVLSATVGGNGSVQGNIRLAFGASSDAVLSGEATAGEEVTIPVAFGSSSSARATLNGREYAVGPAGTCS